MPLFGLSELGSAYAADPTNPDLTEGVDGHRVTYVQLYTSTVKAMESRVPLQGRPHLLTYLLGEGYVSTSRRFREVWQEVDTQRTKLELLEACQPDVPFDARFELVLTEDDPSFLASIRHRALVRSLVLDGLLVQVSLPRKGEVFGCSSLPFVRTGPRPTVSGIREQPGWGAVRRC